MADDAREEIDPHPAMLSAIPSDMASLAGVKTINVGWNTLGVAGAKAIAACPHLTCLKALHFPNNSLGNDGVKEIANSPYLAGLKELYLSRNAIGQEGATCIACTPHISCLEILDINSNTIGDEGTTAIANSPALSSLKILDISMNEISEKGANAISASPYLTHLTYLSIAANPIGLKGAKVIANCPHLAGLTKLDIHHCFIGEEGVTAIADSRRLACLTTLNVGRNSIGDEGVKAIANSSHLAKLASLDIRGNSIGDEGAKAIAESEWMKNLSKLDLSTNSINDAAIIVSLIERLLPAEGGTSGGSLKEICVGRNPLKAADGRTIEMSGLSEFELEPAGKVLDYLRAALRGDAEALPEARLVLVGVGGVGKSQLAGGLAGRLEKGQRAEEYTKGIEIEELRLDVKGFDEPVRVRVFDCGGQPEQFAMHVLVWESLRNAMALVCDATRPFGWDKGNRGDYFLRMIESVLAGRLRDGDETTPPPVLGIVTMADKVNENTPAITTPDMIAAAAANRRLNLEAVAKPVDALHQVGLDDVKVAISKVIAEVPGLASLVSAKFKPVRKAIEDAFGTYDAPNLDQHMIALSPHFSPVRLIDAEQFES